MVLNLLPDATPFGGTLVTIKKFKQKDDTLLSKRLQFTVELMRLSVPYLCLGSGINGFIDRSNLSFSSGLVLQVTIVLYLQC